MSAFFAWLVRTIGIGGCAFLGLYVYDWGIPGAARYAIPRSVPLIGGIGLVDVPIIGDLTTGRAHTYAADQVKLVEAKCAADKSQMVTIFERDALASQLATERRWRLDAEQASTEAEKRADATRRAEATSDAEVERLKAEAAKDEGLPKPTAKELEWLSRH